MYLYCLWNVCAIIIPQSKGYDRLSYLPVNMCNLTSCVLEEVWLWIVICREGGIFWELVRTSFTLAPILPQSSQVKSLPRLKDSRDVSSCGFQSEVMIVKVCSEDSGWQEAEGSWSPEISNDCRNDSGAGCPAGLAGTDWVLLISAQFRLSWGHPWDSDTGVRNEVLITMCTSLSLLHRLRCSRSCLCKSLLSFWEKNY